MRGFLKGIRAFLGYSRSKLRILDSRRAVASFLTLLLLSAILPADITSASDFGVDGKAGKSYVKSQIAYDLNLRYAHTWYPEPRDTLWGVVDSVYTDGDSLRIELESVLRFMGAVPNSLKRCRIQIFTGGGAGGSSTIDRHDTLSQHLHVIHVDTSWSARPARGDSVVLTNPPFIKYLPYQRNTALAESSSDSAFDDWQVDSCNCGVVVDTVVDSLSKYYALDTSYAPCSLSNVHGDILHFPDGLFGYRTWMAFTPFNLMVDENVHIVATNDPNERLWRYPLVDTAGEGHYDDYVKRSGPLFLPGEFDGGTFTADHISDPAIGYADNRLWLVQRISDNSGPKNMLVVTYTEDGYTWAEPDTLLGPSQTSDFISPTFVFGDSGIVELWLVEDLKANRVIKYQSRIDSFYNKSLAPDQQIHLVDTTSLAPLSPNGLKYDLWHVCARRLGTQLIFLVTESEADHAGNNTNLALAKSDDGGLHEFDYCPHYVIPNRAYLEGRHVPARTGSPYLGPYARDVYRATGYFRQTGDGIAMRVFYPHNYINNGYWMYSWSDIHFDRPDDHWMKEADHIHGHEEVLDVNPGRLGPIGFDDDSLFSHLGKLELGVGSDTILASFRLPPRARTIDSLYISFNRENSFMLDSIQIRGPKRGHFMADSVYASLIGGWPGSAGPDKWVAGWMEVPDDSTDLDLKQIHESSPIGKEIDVVFFVRVASTSYHFRLNAAILYGRNEYDQDI